MLPLILVFKSKINVCSESENFEFFQFQKYDEILESRKLLWFTSIKMFFDQRNYTYYHTNAGTQTNV